MDIKETILRFLFCVGGSTSCNKVFMRFDGGLSLEYILSGR